MNNFLRKNLDNSKQNLSKYYQGSGQKSYKLRNHTFRMGHSMISTPKGYLAKKRPYKLIIGLILFLIALISLIVVIPPVIDGKPLSEFFKDFHYFFRWSDPILLSTTPYVTQTFGETMMNLMRGLSQSIMYAASSVFLAILLAIPFALLASNNVVKSKMINQTTRWTMSIIRALPILIIGLLFFEAFYRDITAIFIMTAFAWPTFTKWLYEDLDDIDSNTIKSMEVLGISKTRIIKTVILPSISKRILSSGFYLFEIGIRFSAVLAIVDPGLGGLGLVYQEINFSDSSHWGHLLATIFTISGVMVTLTFTNKLIQRYMVDYKTKRVFLAEQDNTIEFSNKFIKKQPKLHKILAWGFGLGMISLVIVSFFSVEKWGMQPPTQIETLKDNLAQMKQPAWEILSFNTWGKATNPLYTLLDGIWIVFGSFIIGIVFSIPVGLLSSRRISGTIVSGIFNTGLTMIRAVPSYIFVLFFFTFSGVGDNRGALGAVLGLGLGSIGAVGHRVKILADSVEGSFGQTLRTNGGTKWDFIRHALIPKIMPEIIARSTFQLEISFKNLLVIGSYGISAFGYNFNQVAKLNSGAYNQLIIYIGLFAITTIIIEIISNRVRDNIKSGNKKTMFRIYWGQMLMAKYMIKFNSMIINYIAVPFNKINLESAMKEKNLDLSNIRNEFRRNREMYEGLRLRNYSQGGI